ncbi:MAG: AAA family ATPase [Deltaproteobacteria bacterium]|jgi:hypothetical protein|nr:AAA family ATPase [Deltaproteobacteria bacterium]
MVEKLQNPKRVQTFQKIIETNSIYVDKTSYLAKMIEGSPKSLFLARPNGFGKTMTVSTLESIFSGNRELFKGLAIEKKLNEKNFSPRPVIHLDMTAVCAINEQRDFEKNLSEYTIKIASDHGVELSSDLGASCLFRQLIQNVSQKNNSRVVVLIDEYDSPFQDLLDNPKRAKKVRELLRGYYTLLKSSDKYISFVFVTGFNKSIQGGLYSGFNHLFDISILEEYGALTGFTQDEIELYYKQQIEEAAKSLNLSQSELLVKMKRYYNGFSFDGETLLYNPLSLLQFFSAQEFDNFCSKNGNEKQLVSFFRKKRLTLDEFRGSPASRFSVFTPECDRNRDPHMYLYQLGYLSLRSNDNICSYVLDFPNIEVQQSLSRYLLESYFETADIVESLITRLLKAVATLDPAGLVSELNVVLANFSHDQYDESFFDEDFYRGQLLTLLYAAKLDPEIVTDSKLGRTDLVINYGGQTWVLALTLNDMDDIPKVPQVKISVKQILDKE